MIIPPAKDFIFYVKWDLNWCIVVWCFVWFFFIQIIELRFNGKIFPLSFFKQQSSMFFITFYEKKTVETKLWRTDYDNFHPRRDNFWCRDSKKQKASISEIQLRSFVTETFWFCYVEDVGIFLFATKIGMWLTLQFFIFW